MNKCFTDAFIGKSNIMVLDGMLKNLSSHICDLFIYLFMYNANRVT